MSELSSSFEVPLVFLELSWLKKAPATKTCEWKYALQSFKYLSLKKQLFKEIPGEDATLFAFFSAKLNDLFKLLQ